MSRIYKIMLQIVAFVIKMHIKKCTAILQETGEKKNFSKKVSIIFQSATRSILEGSKEKKKSYK